MPSTEVLIQNPCPYGLPEIYTGTVDMEASSSSGSGRHSVCSLAVQVSPGFRAFGGLEITWVLRFCFFFFSFGAWSQRFKIWALQFWPLPRSSLFGWRSKRGPCFGEFLR